MNELSRADAEARERALDPQRSILLQAPAGSGKTSMLTQRFLRLLCTVDDPGEILAITFTRKAAAEMRARVTQALRGEIAADDPCAAQLHTLTAAALRHGTTRGWNLAHDPGALRIQTIDSFTYWLASQLPIAARAGGTLRVTETPQELYRRAARRTLLAAEADAVLGADTELLFERLDNHWNNVERLLADMLEQRAHWLRYVLETGPGQLCARVNASLADIIRDQLAAASAALPPALLRAAQQLPGVGPLGSDPTHLPAWKRLAHCTLTGGRWRVRLTEDLLGPAYAQAAAREALHSCIAHLSRVPGSAQLLQGVAALPAAALSEADEAAIGALSRVLEHAARELHVEFAQQGRVDYAYVTGAARAALTEAGLPTELALRTGLAFTHILVDEFQDTSLAQFQLLESLTAAWQEGDGRTLFLVGDPMQSIYRFRDAEVGLFISAREHGIGNVRLTPLRLTRNFRATPALVEWTNQVFAQVFPAADELRAGAIAFRASAAARVPGAGAPPAGASVQLRLFPGDRDAEARAVAARIGELRGRDRHASWCRWRSGRSCATWCSSPGHCTISATAAPGSPCCARPGVARAWRRSPRSRVRRIRSSCGKRSRTPGAWHAVRPVTWYASRACAQCWPGRSSDATALRRQTGSRRVGYSWVRRMPTRERSSGTHACSSARSPSGPPPWSGGDRRTSRPCFRTCTALRRPRAQIPSRS